MNRLAWQSKSIVSVDPYEIPCAEGLMEQANHKVGIRYDSQAKRVIKSLLWPLFSMRNDLFSGGFIRSNIGKWIRELVRADTTFLEIGCGDMSLRKYLPKDICYNAFDISLSEFHYRRVMQKGGNINVALASATDIPLESESVNLIASTEVFEHISNIDRTMREILRVAMPGAKLVCSIPNNFCYKYRLKGEHPEHVNNWSYEDFIQFMKSNYFKFIKGFMKGCWVPLPTWFTKTSYQLPFASKNEFYCTNFFYQFEVEK